MKPIRVARTILLTLLLACSASATTIDTATLLHEMTDLRAMAEFPSPAYTTRQFSSYDRASTTPSDAKTWFANDDWGKFIRSEKHDGRTEQVMAEMAGPGAIVRIWSANPGGTLRIYLDDGLQPIIETAMKDFVSGKFPGVPEPIACERGQGFNTYLPMPYAKLCKVTVEGPDTGKLYYHVDYRTYPAGTEIKTFAIDDLRVNDPLINSIVTEMQQPVQQAASFQMGKLPPGKGLNIKAAGPNAYTVFSVKVDPTRKDLDVALRSLLLEMTFDGEKTVQAPLGDFFGAAPGVNPFQSLPLQVNASGVMLSRWVMPFEKSASISIKNLGSSDVVLGISSSLKGYTWTDQSMHFHADYHVAYDYKTRPFSDWNVLNANGKGVFAGLSLALDNPMREWWGEGDEKIYVDGETFPSWFGTGSEDYFAYAWGSTQKYSHAYHSQARCDGPANYGRTSVNRFHILDRVPFEKALRFDLEQWHWKETQVNLAAVAYWYGLPGASSPQKDLKAEDLVVRPMPKYEPSHVPGVIEGESLHILEKTAQLSPQSWGGASGDEHLWWHDGPKPNDQIVLGFPVAKAGRYRVAGRFLKAHDYGVHQLFINDAKGPSINFYNPDAVYTDELDLGTFDLHEGENRLAVTCEGADPRATPAYLFSIDYLRLTPTDAKP